MFFTESHELFPKEYENDHLGENCLFLSSVAKTQICAAFRSIGSVLKVTKASAEGASETFRDLFTKTAYDVIIFKFQGCHGTPCRMLATPVLLR